MNYNVKMIMHHWAPNENRGICKGKEQQHYKVIEGENRIWREGETAIM